ncbi:MAG: ribonuclease III, partial [Spirochaetes bacterium]|nr:ribonuclease III [Spirochaetota bacterium]
MAGGTDLEARLGVRFADPHLLESALTHPSLANESKAAGPGNQRLEFLGDSVLALSVSDHLYRLFPDVTEGRLSSLRAKTVSGPTLMSVAAELGLETRVRVGRGHMGPVTPRVLEDALEAIVGAVYLDQGFEAAHGLVGRLFTPVIEALAREERAGSAKSALQESHLKRGIALPEYRVDAVEGPGHKSVFRVSVWAGETRLGDGRGSSKKAAEEEAAKNALLTPPPAPSDNQ